jgi:hypothetical protein
MVFFGISALLLSPSAPAAELGGTGDHRTTLRTHVDFDGAPLSQVVVGRITGNEGDNLLTWDYCYDDDGKATADCFTAAVSWGAKGFDTYTVTADTCDESSPVCYGGYLTTSWARTTQTSSWDAETYDTTVRDVVVNRFVSSRTGVVVESRAYVVAAVIEAGGQRTTDGHYTWWNAYDPSGEWLDGDYVPYIYEVDASPTSCEESKILRDAARASLKDGLAGACAWVATGAGYIVGDLPGTLIGSPVGSAYCDWSWGGIVDSAGKVIDWANGDCEDEDPTIDDPTDPIDEPAPGGGGGGGATTGGTECDDYVQIAEPVPLGNGECTYTATTHDCEGIYAEDCSKAECPVATDSTPEVWEDECPNWESDAPSLGL